MITHVAILYDKLVEPVRQDSRFNRECSKAHKKYIYSLPAPNRHHNLISQLYCETGEQIDIESDDQGFLDDKNPSLFLNRKQAYVLAMKYNQVKDPSKVTPSGWLTSENVW